MNSFLRAVRCWFQRWFGKSRIRVMHKSCRRLVLEDLEERCVPSAGALLVQIEPENFVGDISQIADLAGAEAVSTDISNLYRIAYRISGETTDLADLANQLTGLPGVTYAEWEQTLSMALSPSDPQFTNGSLWGLNGTQGMRAPTAWDSTTGSTQIAVAVIDTGVDYKHPDLYLNIWINQGEIPTTVRNNIQANPAWDIDSDGLITFWDLNNPINQGVGKITDLDGDSRITGADILKSTAQGGWADTVDGDSNNRLNDLIGWDFVNNDNNPMDDHGHGTHVAGTIGAIGNNATGVVGINWKGQIAALKFLDASGSGSDTNAASAILYSSARGIEISNNSYGDFSISSTLSNAITTARNAGRLFVAAAGNDGSNNDLIPFYPASLTQDNVIAVAATTSSGDRAGFSNYGLTSVDLGAPGENILSTVRGTGYGISSGTSMASPHVAGAAALIWSLNPTWTYTQVRDLMFDTVRPLASLAGLTVTGGIVDIGQAVKNGSEIQILENSVVLRDNSGTVNYGGTPPGTSVTKTFTVRNVGNQTLNLGTITIPNGYTMTVGPGSTTLTNGQSTTFQVRLDATTGGIFSGNIVVNSNDASEGVYEIVVTGIVTVPEIQVLDGAVNLVDGSAVVDYGSTATDVPLSRIFTVNNPGTGDLTLSNLSVPAGFTITSNFGSTTLAPGISTTFTVRLDATTAGTYSGQVSFTNNDSDENPFNFTIQGTVSGARVIDNGATGFSTAGAWVLFDGQGFQNDLDYSAAGNGADVATWTFAVTPGQYRVSTTWSTDPNRATNAPFTVLDGATALDTLLLNQEIAPNDFFDSGASWEDIGTFNILGTSLVVRLTDNANEFVIADAVRIERIGDLPSAPEIRVLDGATDLVDGVAVVDYGTTPPGTPLSRTFTVTNLGTTNLTLGTLTVPAGFTVTSGFGSTTLASGASTTFTVRLDAAAAGIYSGQVSFGNNDADENPFNFTIQGMVATVQIIDDGTTGFSTSGSWTIFNGQGFQNDVTYSAAGNGSDAATWAFTVTPGQFRISTTWTTHANRATNAPFTVFDGATALGTTLLNQEIEPNDFGDQGTSWEDIGTFTITDTTLVVRLTDNANEVVIADAVRIARIGELPLAPEIQVLDGATNLVDGSAVVNYGSTLPGTPLSRTFTVTNLGSANLTLGTLTVPAGFTLISSFGSTTLAPGASTTFTVRLDAAAVGTYSGQVSFGNNDTNENPFNFTIQGTVAAVPAVQIIDDGAAGFSTLGSWVLFNGQGFQNDVTYSDAGSGSDAATWTFTMTPGVYRVSATWTTHANRATNAPFTVFDGATALSTVLINQELAPNDLNDQGASWEDIGTFTITDTTLVVRLTDNANEFVIADAIRIARIGELPPGPEIRVVDGTTNLVDGSAIVDYGSTPPGAPLSQTFTVYNLGTTNLTLGTLTVPAGFTVTAGFASTTLAPNTSTTFTVRLDAASVGTNSGQLSFGNNDADENPFNFTIQGTVAAPPAVQIIDDGAAGFSTLGSWVPFNGQGFGNDVSFSAAGNGSNVAIWTFTVEPGVYRVSATWFSHENRATNAPFTVYDGATALSTVQINQELAPDDLIEQGTAWEDLGTFTISGSTLVVRLTNNADEYVIADAIRIEKIG
jgi:subtilisin family serine protease